VLHAPPPAVHVGPLSIGGWVSGTFTSATASSEASAVASPAESSVASADPSVPLDPPLDPPLDVVPLEPPLDVEPLDPSPVVPLLLAVPELLPVPASEPSTALSSPQPTNTTFIRTAAPATAMTPHGRFLMAASIADQRSESKKDHVIRFPSLQIAWPRPGTLHATTGWTQPFIETHAGGPLGDEPPEQRFAIDQWSTLFWPSLGATVPSAAPWTTSVATDFPGHTRWP
jgi:hypothetical protein